MRSLLGARRLLARTGAVLLLMSSGAAAERIHVRCYDVHDGLAHNRVTSMLQDAEGSLWFGTWEGLSRFDGYGFTTFGTLAGLDPAIVFAMARDARGRLWVSAWSGGVACLEGERFRQWRLGTERHANEVTGLWVDSESQLWCRTIVGLYRADANADTTQIHFAPVVASDSLGPAGLDADRHLWFVDRGRLWRTDGGRIRRADSTAAAPHIDGTTMLATAGRTWIVESAGRLFEGRPGGTWEPLPLSLPADAPIRCMLIDHAATLWVGTARGLMQWDGRTARLLTRAEGLTDDFVRSLYEDSEGDLWIATNQSGVCRYAGAEIVSIAPGDLAPAAISHVALGSGGTPLVTVERLGVAQIAGGVLRPVPGGGTPALRDLNMGLCSDARGDWWALTLNDLMRFPGPEPHFQAGRRFGAAEGLLEHEWIGLGSDPARHRIWVGGRNVYWIDVGAPERGFHCIAVDSVTVPTIVRAFCARRDGSVWIGGFQGLGRIVGDRCLPVNARGLPNTNARSLFEDHRGWMWVGLRDGGVGVTRAPDAPAPEFEVWSVRNGLQSNTVWSIAEDHTGRMYFGTGRGLEQLDLETGRLRHFSSADGLAGDVVNDCVPDAAGRIWLATSGGVSRFDPDAIQESHAPPPVYLRRVEVSGVDRSPDLGRVMRLRPAERNLRFEYVGLRFRDEHALRYQYQLEGADHGFGPPTAERVVQYARLAPGTYRFVVRAIAPDGVVSDPPAAFAFQIAPPIWRQAWFAALVAVAGLAAAFTIHRLRVRRILALEGVRQRIALDLHDDIGAGLAQIAILSEVGRRSAPPQTAAVLEESAALARRLRGDMADIVWAIDPRRDRLADVVARVRQTAFTLLEADGVEVTFRAPDESALERLALSPDRRRSLFLWCKEALVNVARHAQAQRVQVDIEFEAQALRIAIRDDGRGFDAAASHAGTGLRSLRQRAADLGGTLHIDSRPETGTCVALAVPLGRRRRARPVIAM